MATAISATTNASRSRPVASPPCPRGPASPGANPRPDAFQAGRIPNAIPVNMEMAAVKATTRPSVPTPSRRGSASGIAASRTWVPQAASRIPHAPPASARTRLSVRICRTRRPRLAPSAVRTASSARRDDALARRRFARFAQAIRRTRPTAPARIHNGRRLSPTIPSSRATKSGRRDLSSSGCSTARRFIAASRSARAAAAETPGERRSTLRSMCAPRACAAWG